MKIIMKHTHLPKIDKIMSMIPKIDDLLEAEYKKSGDWKSKEVEEINLWSDYIDVAYNSNEISFQFLENLNKIVRKYGYEINEQLRTTNSYYNTKIVLKTLETEVEEY